MSIRSATLSFLPPFGFNGTTVTRAVLSPASTTSVLMISSTTSKSRAISSRVHHHATSSRRSHTQNASRTTFSTSTRTTSTKGSALHLGISTSTGSSVTTAHSQTATTLPDTASPAPDKLPLSTTIGISAGVGALVLISLIAVCILFCRKRKDRQRSFQPPGWTHSLYYRRSKARLWKGFTPAPSVRVSYAGDLASPSEKHLLSPCTPSPALSSPFTPRHARFSWQDDPHPDAFGKSPMQKQGERSPIYELPTPTIVVEDYSGEESRGARCDICELPMPRPATPSRNRNSELWFS